MRYRAWMVGIGLLLAGCTAPAADTTGSTDATGPEQGAPITVYAAASLREVFDEIGADVAQQTGTEVNFVYAGSSDLAAQLVNGAPGDVFASANERQMTVAVDGGAVEGETQIFAENTLTIVTPPDNPAGIAGLADLVEAPRVVLCAPEVPCGAASQTLLEQEGLAVQPVSEEQSVTDVLGKVSAGEADAGLVYVTDATRAADRVATIDTPEAAGVVNRYPIALTTHGADDPGRRSTAEAFIETVLGERGRTVLDDAGFGTDSS